MCKRFVVILAVLFSASQLYAQTTIISGKIVDHHLKALKGVQVNLNLDDEINQKLTGPDGTFRISSKKLNYDNQITLKVSAKNYEPIDERDLTFKIEKNKIVLIRLSPIGMQKKISDKFSEESLIAFTHQVKILTDELRASRQRGQISDSAYRSQIRMINEKKLKDSALIVQTSALYAQSSGQKISPGIQQSFDMIRQGRIDEAKQLLNNDDDSSELKKIDDKIKEWFTKAELAQSLADFKKADVLYKRVLQRDASNLNYQLKYINFLVYYTDRNEEGLTFLDKVDTAQIKDVELKANILNHYGMAYNGINNLEKSRLFYRQQIDLANHSKSLDSKIKGHIVARSLNNIGVTYTGINDSIAVDYYKRAIEVLKKSHDIIEPDGPAYDLFVVANLNLGRKYVARGNLSIAKSYLEEALKTLTTSTKKSPRNVEHYYETNESLYEIILRYDKSQQTVNLYNAFLDTLVKLNNEFNNHFASSVKNIHLATATVYDGMQDYRNAFLSHVSALQVFRSYYSDTSISDNYEMGDVYFDMAVLLEADNKKDKARPYYDSARMCYVKAGTLVEFYLDKDKEDYADKKLEVQVRIANYYRRQNDEIKWLQNLEKADELLKNARLSEKKADSWQNRLTKAYTRYFSARNQRVQAYTSMIKNIDIYENRIRNNFINELAVADLEKSAADEYYYASFDFDSVALLKESIRRFEKALPVYHKFYLLDTLYVPHVLYVQYSLAEAYKKSENFENATKYYQQALIGYRALPEQMQTMNSWYSQNRICHALAQISRDPQASLDYLKESLNALHVVNARYKPSQDMKFDLAAGYNNIGSEYSALKMKDSALRYFNLALNLLDEKRLDSKDCMSCWLAARSNLADYMNRENESEKEFEIRYESAHYLENTLKLDSLLRHFQRKDAQRAAATYYRLAALYLRKSNYDSAIIAIDKAIYIFNKYNYNDSLTKSWLNGCYNNLGYYLVLSGKPSVGIEALKKAKTYLLPTETAEFEMVQVNTIFAYLFNGQFSKTKKLYNELVATQPSKKEAYKKMVVDEIADYEKRNKHHKDFPKLKEYVTKK